MSAKRVPAGWTREAADFAWEDWRGALAGEPRMMPDDEGAYDDTTLAPEWRAALLLLSQRGHLTRAANDDGADYYWTSPEARLRAWAAVGAPVIAPAEDGRPSLAEWVAAMSASHWGQPLTINTMPGGEPFTVQWLTGPTVRLWTKRHPENPGAHVCLVAPATRFGRDVWRDCATPEQLRALLDTLARPA